MEKIKDFEMNIRKTTRSTAKCKVCGYYADEMYLFRRHGKSQYLCRTCISDLLMIASLQE